MSLVPAAGAYPSVLYPRSFPALLAVCVQQCDARDRRRTRFRSSDERESQHDLLDLAATPANTAALLGDPNARQVSASGAWSLARVEEAGYDSSSS